MKLMTKIKVVISITLIVAVTYTLYSPANDTEAKVIEYDEPVVEQYIVTEEMVLQKLKSKAQIISMEQSFSNAYTKVDDSWMGERHTKFDVSGVYRMGLEIEDIKVKRIEQNIIHIELPEPKLISLEIPYDQIVIHKEKGLFRSEMNDEDKKHTYIAIEKEIIKEITSDTEIIKQANLYNQDVVKSILNDLAGVSGVIFEN